MRISKQGLTRKAFIGAFSLAVLAMPSSVYAVLAKVYNLTETDSTIIKFDKALKRALIANPELATAKVLNSRELLITGKGAGRTQLIVTYRDKPNTDHQVVLNVSPDQSRREEITSTLKTLLADLNPQGTVKFDLKNIWVNSEGAVRRQIDEIGNQIDGEGTAKTEKRKDKQILQTETASGELEIQPLAGNYMVLLKGTVPNKAQKKRIHSVVSALGLSVVNMINITGPQQIKLSVRVAEVVKGNPFRSGIALRDKKDQFGIFPPGNLGTTASFLLNVDQVAAGTAASMSFPHSDGFQIGVNPTGGDLFGVLSILEGNNLARVLAKPELIVQSGETADFLVGGEVPIPVAQNENTITIEYKEFGIRLRFSPIITESGQIQMTVAPEVSNIDATAGYQLGTIQVPGFRSRKTNTTITMAAGQSFVIGGLIQDNLRSSVSRVPFLSEIPIIGTLFRSTSYEKDQSELAILVTPTFVEPIEKGAKITLPGENLVRASISDGFWNGKIAELLPEGQSALPELSVKIGLETP
ncbi:type II and III secretion system protein family protein [Thiomicrorhabdus lithotrophica]|uniref:Pilus assembly protein N-terminal domain-containing protein n=1 Tax=Thiomicrorhabdus lithotrophica TaxID=2949997 RepID=A0ABY8CCQ7_9GAMM|nr:pilus assembly protein N-terminal domain-containing protein [Thiomicrorhabdus lithotrophica]WEJ62572.1 pilus assembly protein N-terminal domain-containing protein [Thiomicrorhabdus lithotrophica]